MKIFSILVCSGVKIPNYYSSGHDSIRLSQMIECEDLKEEKMRLESQEKKLTDLEILEKSRATNKNRFLMQLSFLTNSVRWRLFD